jgi:hypothetical protein
LPTNSTPDCASPSDLVVLQPRDGVASIEKAAAALELQLEVVKTERKQERFFWIFGVVGLMNVIIVNSTPWYGASCFLLFSLIFLIAAARYLEVPWIVQHLERWLDRASATSGKDDTE